MKVSESTARAHWESVEHWFDLYQIATHDPRCISKEDISWNHCPNCIEAGGSEDEYRRGGYPDCKVCPIGKFSGNEDCEGTPWGRVFRFLRMRCERLALGEKLHHLVLDEYRYLLDVAFDIEVEAMVSPGKQQ